MPWVRNRLPWLLNSIAAHATSNKITRGRALYMRYCASCNGFSADGDGPVAHALTTPPTKLRRLSERFWGPLSEDEVARYCYIVACPFDSDRHLSRLTEVIAWRREERALGTDAEHELWQMEEVRSLGACGLISGPRWSVHFLPVTERLPARQPAKRTLGFNLGRDQESGGP
jgi:hypothetical protein